MSPTKILLLNRYGSKGASSRLRTLQYLPYLDRSGFDFTVSPLFDDNALSARYRLGDYSLSVLSGAMLSRVQAMLRKKQFDLIWIEKEALPWMPLWLETALLSGIPYVLDYDDAVFHNYDLHRRPWVRRIFGRRLDGLMAKSALVVAGNEYLAQRARSAGCRAVAVVPTVIDLTRYVPRSDYKITAADGLPRIVWIGSPSTAKYLELLRIPLQHLGLRIPFVLRVIGAQFAIDGVQVETVPWTEDSEVASVAACEVGVMPLQDSPWERGKCGYKLIQYMACGLPVVASPVGVNSEIVQSDVNGYLPATDAGWVDVLERLLTQPELRASFGAAGRSSVEKKYCIQVTHGIIAKLLRDVARRN